MKPLATILTSLWLWITPVAADERAERLMRAMHVTDIVEIMGQEGLEQGRELDKAMLDGAGGTYFQAQIEEIYDADWMREKLTRSVDDNLSDTQLEQAALFFESKLGQTIVSLENSARLAMMDDAIDEVARQIYRQADRDTAFYKLVDEYVQVNDLIEQNVRGSLSADLNFFLGMSDNRGVQLDGDSMLSQLLDNTEEVTAETEAWIYSFLLMAYQPLSEAQMRENIAFSRTETGRALNEALFRGFDEMIDAISYRLGEAVGRAMSASDL